MLLYDFDAMRDYEDMKMGRGGYEDYNDFEVEDEERP